MYAWHASFIFSSLAKHSPRKCERPHTSKAPRKCRIRCANSGKGREPVALINDMPVIGVMLHPLRRADLQFARLQRSAFAPSREHRLSPVWLRSRDPPDR